MAEIGFYQQEEYELEKIIEIIEDIFEKNNFADKLKNKRVLLKVNLLMGKDPETAVTTHPVFVIAVARTVKKYGGEPFLADSPGGPFTSTALKYAYGKSGYIEPAEAGEFDLNYNTDRYHFDYPEGQRAKSFQLCSYVKESDVIINLPKLKTHGLTLYTGAVKNLFGLIPGLSKAEYHFKLPKISDFCQLLLDLHFACEPDLTIMDGITGMEGEGPSGGEARNFQAVLVSQDAVYLDTIVSYLLRKDKYRSDPWPEAFQARNIDVDFDKNLIPDWLKANFQDVKTPKVDRTSGLINMNLPEPIKKLVEGLLRPKPVILDNCVACGICAQNCPAQVIEIKEKAEIDLSGCIRCFCCQELCPHQAVKIKRPLLGKLLF
ncbi:MAG: DUF362 domain-containing protein [Bacillota bacterium]